MCTFIILLVDFHFALLDISVEIHYEGFPCHRESSPHKSVQPYKEQLQHPTVSRGFFWPYSPHSTGQGHPCLILASGTWTLLGVPEWITDWLGFEGQPPF